VTSTGTPPARRLGAATSKTRAQLLDATEQLLLEDGYAAVTSRRVGAKAGLKPQLVHYYFRSMEDLFLEVFRRRADASLARAEQTLAADPSLRSLWRLNADLRGAAFNIEFVALANHHKAIRAEVAAYAERFRAMQLGALTRALAAHEATRQLPPEAVLLLMTGLTQVLSLERALGVTAGHDETLAFVERAIDALDREP
jgi:AcrR family transcriptional regulator